MKTVHGADWARPGSMFDILNRLKVGERHVFLCDRQSMIGSSLRGRLPCDTFRTQVVYIVVKNDGESIRGIMAERVK